MTIPRNAFPIAPSKEPHQLLIDNKALPWNNLQIRTYQGPEQKKHLIITPSSKIREAQITAHIHLFFSYPHFPHHPKTVSAKCWAEQVVYKP